MKKIKKIENNLLNKKRIIKNSSFIDLYYFKKTSFKKLLKAEYKKKCYYSRLIINDTKKIKNDVIKNRWIEKIKIKIDISYSIILN